MRELSNQRNALLCMVSVLGVVMRMGVKMRMGNGRTTDNVNMIKENRTCVVTYKKHYEKRRYYFLYSTHKIYGGKDIK